MPTINIDLFKRPLFLVLRGSGLFLAFLALSGGSCPPTPVVDEPASNLSATVTIIDTEANPSDGKVGIIIQFFQGGKYVQLAGGAAITCNGVNLPLGGLGYAERVPIVAVGGTYNCVHSRSAVNTQINVVVPARPAITSPAAVSTVTRSNSLTINYVADGGVSISCSASDGSKGVGEGTQNDTGSYTGLDVSTLNAGPGSIGIIRKFDNPLPAPGFISVQLRYSSGKRIDVTWN